MIYAIKNVADKANDFVARYHWNLVIRNAYDSEDWSLFARIPIRI